MRDEGEKYVTRAIEASDSMPNGVKFFAWALLADASKDEEKALEALANAERYLEAARSEFGRRFGRELPALRFLERGVALRKDRAEWDEAIRLCDLALALGLGPEWERKRRSLERMA